MKKLMMGTSLAILLMLAGAASAFIFGGDDERPEARQDMTVAEARALIQARENLETIPKSVWKQLLTEGEYQIMWEKGTEKAFTGELLENKEAGVYVTAGCRIPVFRSDHKFESGTGWPSFWEVFDKDNVVLKTDRSWGMRRTEVLSRCGEHLGHLFEDGPEPTGLRYCINSAALDFVSLDELRAAEKRQQARGDGNTE